MFKWIQQFRDADPHTRYFIINWALYGILIVASTVYVYARLDYVRSTPPKHKKTEQNIQK